MENLNGSMYIGFRGFHPTYGNNITRFDGTNFYPLGPGLNAEVQALAIYNGQLVASGLFTADGNNIQPLNGIAVWDGIQWNPFPGGCELNGDIYYLNVYDSILIGSGNFDSCGVVHTGGSVIYPNGLTTLPETEDEPFQFTVFPNPSDGIFQVHYNIENSESLRLEIIDCMGKIIFVQQLNEKSSTVEIKTGEFLTNGLYVLRLISSNSIAQKKIIINRD